MIGPTDIVLIAITLVVLLIFTWWIFSIVRPVRLALPLKSIAKLTVRDLLWLTVVVALSVLLWMEYSEVMSLREARRADVLIRQRQVARYSINP